MLVEETVLDSLLVMLVRVEVIVLEVVEKPACDRPDTLDIIDCGRELLFAMLYGILEVFECKDELEQRIRVQLERGSILGTLRHIVRLVKYYNAVGVVQSVVRPHGLVEHVVVRHQDEVSLSCSLLVHVKWTDRMLSGDLVEILNIVWLIGDGRGTLGVFGKKLAFAALNGPVAPVLQIVSLSKDIDTSTLDNPRSLKARKGSKMPGLILNVAMNDSF